ncbi:hypothetical protein lerEdw1_010205 [Lerista edwardsae]|nr:hypothetical protein lerEdw1_010205 [Lerista edwardsae]
MAEVEKTFRKFAVFKDPATSSNDMSGKNFSKILKECGVMDGRAVTSTDVDIAFSTYKSKGSRSINYLEFLHALKDLSSKRFKGKSSEEALAAVVKLMEGKEPATLGQTRSDMDSGVPRLNSGSRYSVSQKDLCDENSCLAPPGNPWAPKQGGPSDETPH